jgi:hypothetical protein
VSGIATLSRRQSIATIGTLSAIIAFYAWTAATSEWPARPAPANGFYYSYLARAFLAGQVHLLVQPNPQLLALADPYDPVQNQPYRLHDAVFFQGKYYLYYGPTPALVLFVPFRALTGLDCTEPLAVTVFCSIGLVYAFLIVQFLTRRYLPETPFTLLLAAAPAMGFGTAVPFLLRRPLHYEVAISCGYAFVLASVYHYLIGALGERFRWRQVALGSLLLGLAGGARFPTLAAGLVPLVLGAYTMAMMSRSRPSVRRYAAILLAFFGPVALCVLLLGLYNYIRFGSWTEFGIRYTLQGYQSPQTYKFYSLARLPAGLFYYLLAPPAFSAEFPFVTLAPARYLSPPPDFYLEPVGGLLPDSPLTIILLLSPAALLFFRRERLALYLVCAALLVIGIELLLLYGVSAGTMRYEVDFAAFLLVPALLLWFGALNALKPDSERRALAGMAFGALLLATVIFNTAFSIVGYYDNLKRGEPAVYEAIHDVFRPLERLLR